MAPDQELPPNAALPRPGENCASGQVVDEKRADSGPLQRLLDCAVKRRKVRQCSRALRAQSGASFGCRRVRGRAGRRHVAILAAEGRSVRAGETAHKG